MHVCITLKVIFRSFKYRKIETSTSRDNVFMHQNVKWGRGGAGGWGAHRIVHKIEENETFEMDVMQKLHVGKLSNFAHKISTYGCLYQHH